MQPPKEKPARRSGARRIRRPHCFFEALALYYIVKNEFRRKGGAEMLSLYSMLVEIEREFGVRLSVHDVSGITYTSQALELPYEWKTHSCAYCSAVKAAMTEERCMRQKEVALRRLKQGGVRPYFGVCFMGVCDYLQPVFCEGSLVAIVFASAVTREDEAAAREKAARRIRRTGGGIEEEPLLKAFDAFASRSRTTRGRLRFFAELVAEKIERDAHYHSNSVHPPQGQYPVEAVRKRNAGLSSAIVTYIDRCYSSKLTLKGLSSIFFISEGHLCRLVRRETGMSVMNYVRRLRIEEAARELARSDKPIHDVARQVGFTDVNYFCRCFRASMGQTPSAYRARNAQAKDPIE